MLMIICTKYGKNPPRTVDATQRTRFSRPRLNDLEDKGQGQRSLYATHPLIKVIICAKYKKESIQNCRRYRADTIFLVKAEWPWRYRSRSRVIKCDTPSHAMDHLYQIWNETILNCRCYRANTGCGTDGRTDGVKPIHPQQLRCVGV